MLKNLDILMSEETGLSVIFSKNPLSAVAKVTGTVLKDLSI
jgi:actin-like ATPase involved in cell morphogenesis